jgi:hypothetical protein
MIVPAVGDDAPPLSLPEPKTLVCNEQGRDCKFR